MMIDKAIRIAARSPQRTHQTGAVLVSSRGSILACGWSHIGARTLSLRSTHAELHALLRAPQGQLIGGTVYVATLSRKSGNATMAKPCVHCKTALEHAGITRAVFTTPTGVREMDIADIHNCKEYKRVPKDGNARSIANGLASV